MSDTLGTRNAGQEPLEELVEDQALSLDLREAVMACLSGRESRRWTVGELVERFKNLGVCASRASVTAALAELALERGTEWILAPKSELLELLSGVRRHRKGGVSKTRVGEILGLEASSILDDLLSQGLI